MGKVSGHSGWPEEKELDAMWQKAKLCKEKREKQIAEICAVLAKMPKCERFALIVEVIKRERGLQK